MLYPLIKSVLFTLPPEDAHDLALKIAALSPALGRVTGASRDSRLALTIGSCRWASPIGLAAGLDKNGEALPFFEAQGFGAIECGTITLKGQVGNPKPRLFRYPEEDSLRNSMGFPNQGLNSIWPRLRSFEKKIPLGANIGKNKESDRAQSIEELTLLYEALAPFADYFVVNVSSPNTPGLRAFQEKGYLDELFTELNFLRKEIKKDLYLKIAPDLEKEKIVELTHMAQQNNLTGLIATNTTIMPERGMGGVSGQLLKKRAQSVRTIILQQQSNLELIGVGGVSDFNDLLDFWQEGGKVMQIYTSYIYQGPGILGQFKTKLLSFLQFQQLSDLNKFFSLPLSERQQRIKEYRVKVLA